MMGHASFPKDERTINGFKASTGLMSNITSEQSDFERQIEFVFLEPPNWLR